MNPEHSTPLRGLLIWTGSMLLGVLGLYVLGAGPASYYSTRYFNTHGRQGSAATYQLMGSMYAPLEAGVEKTSLQRPLADYCRWWGQRAAEKYPMIWTR